MTDFAQKFSERIMHAEVISDTGTPRETIPYQITAPCGGASIRDILLEKQARALASPAAQKAIAARLSGNVQAQTKRKRRFKKFASPSDHKPKAEGAGDTVQFELRFKFVEHIPKRPYCSNAKGAHYIRPREIALGHRYIQLNNPATTCWLTFDVDRPGGYYASGDANLPPETFAAVNPENGHAHLAYRLETPVAVHNAARQGPLNYLAAVERGFTNRLDADKHFVGLILKNPVHPDWFVEWRRDEGYTLSELNDWLFDDDKRLDPTPREQYGFGRNCTTFDELRVFSYREVLRFKRNRDGFDTYHERLQNVALGINRQFVNPLPFAEIRAITKSVAKWTWKRFSPEAFSAIQRARINKRWAGHESESATKPWLNHGVSRATYYRHKAQGDT